MEGAQNRINVWCALCEQCNLNNMDVGLGSSVCLLGFVCVFALVFIGNVAVVKVCPLPVWRSLKNRSLQNCSLFEGEQRLMSPTIQAPFLLIWTNFEVVVVICAHLGCGGNLVYHHRSHIIKESFYIKSNTKNNNQLH